LGYTVADAVSEALGELHYLHEAFRQDVVNYSAVARLLKPLVQERVGQEVGLDAIVMAIRRYAESLPKHAPDGDVLRAVKDCTLLVETDLACLDIKHWRAPDFHAGLERLLFQGVDWHAGEKIYLIQRAYELTIVASTRFVQPLLELTGEGRAQLMARHDAQALMTLTLPDESVPGVYAFFANQFWEAGINVTTVFHSYRKLSFVVEEKDAARAYDHLSRAIGVARRLHEAAQKVRQTRLPAAGLEQQVPPEREER
jgi:hypothetical protein